MRRAGLIEPIRRNVLANARIDLKLVGYFVAGLGLGNVSPLVYGAGGDDAQTGSGAGVAVITTLGYSGFLIGPALIGFTAQHASIDVAFAIVAAFCDRYRAARPGVAPPRAQHHLV